MTLGRLSGHAEALGELQHGRSLEHRAVLQERHGQPSVVDADHLQQLARLAVALDVHPARRNAVAGHEIAQVVRVLGEAVADDAQPARLERRARLPGREQILEHREELLLGRIPRLEQVVVERDLVDRRDGRARVRIGGEQHALGVGHDRARLHQEIGARHDRHALVGQEQRDLVAARAQLLEDLERVCAGARPQDAVALAEPAPQVARDRGEDDGIVVDGDDHGPPLAGRRFGLRCPLLARECTRHREYGTRTRAAVLGSDDCSCYCFGG